MNYEVVAVVCLGGALIGVCALVAMEWMRDAAYREYREQTRWIVAQMVRKGLIRTQKK